MAIAVTAQKRRERPGGTVVVATVATVDGVSSSAVMGEA